MKTTTLLNGYTIWAILVSICIYTISCKKDCSGSSCYDKDGKFYGTVYLNDANKHWLAFFDASNVVVFRNNNGVGVNYNPRLAYRYDKSKINERYTKGEKCCEGDKLYYQDYFYLQKEELADYFTIDDQAISINFHRMGQNTYTVDAKDSLIVNRSEEVLTMDFFDGNEYTIHTDTSFNSGSQMYHHTITLKGKTFYDVFELTGFATNTSSRIPKEVYFSFSKGVVAYTLNNDLWVLQ
jgi:hypothetical protein